MSDAPAIRPFEPQPRPGPSGPSGRPPELVGSGLTGAGEGLAWLWQIVGQSPSSREQWSELLRLAVTSAETPVRAEALNVAGRFASEAGDLTTAHNFFQEALIAGRAGQNSVSVARSLSGLAQVSASRGAFELARELQTEALEIQRRLRDVAGVARSLAILGWLLLESRGARQAEVLLNESLTLRVTLGEPLPQAYSLVHLGWLAHLSGRQEEARAQLSEALTAVRACPDRWKIVALLALLGRPSVAETPVRQAIRLLVGAEAVESAAAIQEEDPADLDGCLAEARDRLDARLLAIAWGGGRRADAEGLVEQALQATEAQTQPDGAGVPAPAEPMPLTPRELEVSILISQGFTNRLIAEKLVIAERTAETHARNIREKLGLSTRPQIAAWVVTRLRPDHPNGQNGTS